MTPYTNAFDQMAQKLIKQKDHIDYLNTSLAASQRREIQRFSMHFN